MGRRARTTVAVGVGVIIIAGVAVSGGADLDAASQEALGAALRLLQDPASRDAAIAGNPRASEIDRQIRSMAGSDRLVQEFYSLAADVFQELTRNSGGDTGKMSELLERGSADPSSLAAMLSPRTLERIRGLATKISDRPR